MPAYHRIVALATVSFAVLAETVGCYDIDAQFSLRAAWQRVATSWIATALFMVTLGFLLKASDDVSRAWALGWFVSGGLMLLTARVAMTIWVRRLKRQGIFDQRVAIFGAGPQGARLANYIQTHDKLTIALVGFFDDRRDGRVGSTAAGLPVLGNLAALVAAIRDGRLDQVIVALPWSAELRLQTVVSALALTPVRIRLAPDLASFAFAQRPVVLLGEMPVMTLFERPISGIDAWLKALEDRVLGLIALVLVSPLLALIAIAIKLDSKGPVLFRQPREGFNNQPFFVYKFRSMFHDRSEVDNIRQASRGDPRVTRVGRVIRALSFDELPQLFNVLQGNMSLVGPRPHAASTRAGGKLFSDVVLSYAGAPQGQAGHHRLGAGLRLARRDRHRGQALSSASSTIYSTSRTGRSGSISTSCYAPASRWSPRRTLSDGPCQRAGLAGRPPHHAARPDPRRQQLHRAALAARQLSDLLATPGTSPSRAPISTRASRC